MIVPFQSDRYLSSSRCKPGARRRGCLGTPGASGERGGARKGSHGSLSPTFKSEGRQRQGWRRALTDRDGAVADTLDRIFILVEQAEVSGHDDLRHLLCSAFSGVQPAASSPSRQRACGDLMYSLDLYRSRRHAPSDRPAKPESEVGSAAAAQCRPAATVMCRSPHRPTAS